MNAGSMFKSMGIFLVTYMGVNAAWIFLMAALGAFPNTTLTDPMSIGGFAGLLGNEWGSFLIAILHPQTWPAGLDILMTAAYNTPTFGMGSYFSYVVGTGGVIGLHIPILAIVGEILPVIIGIYAAMKAADEEKDLVMGIVLAAIIAAMLAMVISIIGMVPQIEVSDPEASWLTKLLVSPIFYYNTSWATTDYISIAVLSLFDGLAWGGIGSLLYRGNYL